MEISSVGSLLLQSGGYLTNFPVPLGVQKLVLNGQNLHMLSVALGFGLLGRYMDGGMYVCISICTSMCVVTFVYSSVGLYIYICAIVSLLPCQTAQTLTGYIGIPLL